MRIIKYYSLLKEGFKKDPSFYLRQLKDFSKIGCTTLACELCFWYSFGKHKVGANKCLILPINSPLTRRERNDIVKEESRYALFYMMLRTIDEKNPKNHNSLSDLVF